MEQPIFDDHIKLEKGEAKGSWTFVTMPIMPHLPKKKNSTVKVRGFIDDYELKDIHIWAMKKGTFLAVKTEIRKAIKKESGDTETPTVPRRSGSSHSRRFSRMPARRTATPRPFPEADQGETKGNHRLDFRGKNRGRKGEPDCEGY